MRRVKYGRGVWDKMARSLRFHASFLETALVDSATACMARTEFRQVPVFEHVRTGGSRGCLPWSGRSVGQAWQVSTLSFAIGTRGTPVPGCLSPVSGTLTRAFTPRPTMDAMCTRVDSEFMMQHAFPFHHILRTDLFPFFWAPPQQCHFFLCPTLYCSILRRWESVKHFSKCFLSIFVSLHCTVLVAAADEAMRDEGKEHHRHTNPPISRHVAVAAVIPIP